MKEHYEDRRKNGGLSHDQFEILKARLREELTPELQEALWDDIYQRVGRSVLTKGLWLCGAVLAAACAWFHGAGYIKFPGSTE